MNKKNIEHSIVNNTQFNQESIPLDVLFIKGKDIKSQSKSTIFSSKNIHLKHLHYKGQSKKTPYSPISSIYSQEF